MTVELTDREELLLRAMLARVRIAAAEACAGRENARLDGALVRIAEDLPTFAAVALGDPLDVDGRPLTTGRIFGRGVRASRVSVALFRLEVLTQLQSRIRVQLEAAREDYYTATERLQLSGVIEGLERAHALASSVIEPERAVVRARRRGFTAPSARGGS